MWRPTLSPRSDRSSRKRREGTLPGRRRRCSISAMRRCAPRRRSRADKGETFDDRVFACVLSAALADQAATDAADRGSRPDARRSDGAVSRRAFRRRAPLRLERAPDPARIMEEDLLRDLLSSHGAGRGEETGWLASILARARWAKIISGRISACSTAANSTAAARHFPALHAGNVEEHAVEEVFYRRLCELEGFSLCAAPHCRSAPTSLLLRRRGRHEPPRDGRARTPAHGMSFARWGQTAAVSAAGRPRNVEAKGCSSRTTLSARITNVQPPPRHSSAGC